MNQWTVGKRIFVSNAALMALVVLVSAAAITSFSRLQHFAGVRLRDDAVPGMISAGELAQYGLGAQVLSLTAGNETDPAKCEQFIAGAQEKIAKAGAMFERLEASTAATQGGGDLAGLRQKSREYGALLEEYFELLKSGRRAEAGSLMTEKINPAFASYQAHLAAILSYHQDAAMEVANDMAGTARNAAVVSSIIAIASILIALGICGKIIHDTDRRLARIARTLEEGSSQVAGASSSIAASGQSLAEGAGEQAASLEETSASLEELSSMTKRNADSAETTKNLSQQTKAAAEAGVADMVEMRKVMSEVKTAADNIAKIIKTIDEIAFQTDILALNAAVEAARAGESGAGFAVVADEVRNLAQRSARAAKETADTIEDSIDKSRRSEAISNKVTTSLEQIVAKARQADALVGEIAEATKEQAQGVAQINIAILEINKITQANAASAEEAASTGEKLDVQAGLLKQGVDDLSHMVGRRQVHQEKPSEMSREPSPAPARPPGSKVNGHERPVSAAKPEPGHSTPAVAALDARQLSAIPMDDDFKDF